jgi:hypothetical protein
MNHRFVNTVFDHNGVRKFERLAGDSISQVKVTEVPNYGRTVDGYSVRSGMPTRYMVRLQGEPRWRRLKCILFGNSGSLVLTIKGGIVFVDDYNQPKLVAASKS